MHLRSTDGGALSNRLERTVLPHLVVLPVRPLLLISVDAKPAVEVAERPLSLAPLPQMPLLPPAARHKERV